MTRRRSAVTAAWLVCLLMLCGLLAACGGSDDPSLLGSPEADVELLRADEQAILDEQAKAIESGDLELFLSHVDRGNKALIARRTRWFNNVTQLPLEQLGFTVMPGSWPDVLIDPAWGKDVRLPQVQVLTQLRGFDEKPVVQTTGFAFAHRDGVTLMVSDRARGGGVFPGSRPAPWDLTRIHVRDSYDVLGVFDDTFAPRATELSDLVQEGIWSLNEALPFTWNGRVVVYAFANQQVLDSFEDVPGGNINHLGALAFPVYADGNRKSQAGMRFTLLPSSIKAGEPFIGRITRHELSHVAIGSRDDGDPTWVSEGIAEWLGARELPDDQRRIPTVALTRARAGVTSLPDTAVFNGPDQEWNYALSWMAIDYIADSQGESKVWELMDALHDNGDGTSDDNQDMVLQQVLGFDSHTLAIRAADRILKLYT